MRRQAVRKRRGAGERQSGASADAGDRSYGRTGTRPPRIDWRRSPRPHGRHPWVLQLLLRRPARGHRGRAPPHRGGDVEEVIDLRRLPTMLSSQLRRHLPWTRRPPSAKMHGMNGPRDRPPLAVPTHADRLPDAGRHGLGHADAGARARPRQARRQAALVVARARLARLRRPHAGVLATHGAGRRDARLGRLRRRAREAARRAAHHRGGERRQACPGSPAGASASRPRAGSTTPGAAAPCSSGSPAAAGSPSGPTSRRPAGRHRACPRGSRAPRRRAPRPHATALPPSARAAQETPSQQPAQTREVLGGQVVPGRRVEHHARLGGELVVARPHQNRESETRQGLEGEGRVRQLERPPAGGRGRPAERLEPALELATGAEDLRERRLGALRERRRVEQAVRQLAEGRATRRPAERRRRAAGSAAAGR